MSDAGYIGRFALLVVGDASVLFLSVWVALFVRHFGSLPDSQTMQAHLAAFSILICIWLWGFALAGLYNMRTLMPFTKTASTIAAAQVVNISIAILFFFTVSVFGIAPKTVLIVYLVVSTLLLFVWRLYVYPSLLLPRKRGVVILGRDDSINNLVHAINADAKNTLRIEAVIRPGTTTTKNIERAVSALVKSGVAEILVVETRNEHTKTLLPYVRSLMIQNEHVRVMDLGELYATTLERLPLVVLEDVWAIEYLSRQPSFAYVSVTRVIDVCAGVLLLCVLALVLPIVGFALYAERRGPIFIAQQRVGKHTKPFWMYKLRSMRYSDDGVWLEQNEENHVTRVGAFLRRTHIDELPQGWNLIRGDVSLVGPRPDMLHMYTIIAKHIPLYELRYLAAPGVTGWAQVAQAYRPGTTSPQSIEDTKQRLEYDLFYMLNRSFIFDMRIIVRTLGNMFIRN